MTNSTLSRAERLIPCARGYLDSEGIPVMEKDVTRVGMLVNYRTPEEIAIRAVEMGGTHYTVFPWNLREAIVLKFNPSR